MKLASRKVIFVLGSGGHTTEMLKMLSNYNFEKYQKTTFIIAEGDRFSQHKLEKMYRNTQKGEIADLEKKGKVEYVVIPRSRNVGQSFKTSVLTTLKSI